VSGCGDAGIAGFAIRHRLALAKTFTTCVAARHRAGGCPIRASARRSCTRHGDGLAMISVTLYERQPNGGLHLMLPGYLAAVPWHAGFNQLLMAPGAGDARTVVVLPFVIYLVFSTASGCCETGSIRPGFQRPACSS